MNKLLLFLLLLPFGVSAQLIQKNTTYGMAFNRTGADTLFYLPVDTFTVPTVYRTYNFMARKATTLYIWNTSTFAWQAVSSGGGAAGWELTGNSGTTAGTNFIGTTDAVALVVKTNNTERARVLSGGNVGIGTSTPDSTLTVSGGLKFITGRQGTGKILISGSDGGADWGSGQRFAVSGEDNSATAGRIMDMNNYPLRIDSMRYLYMAATRASDTSKQIFRMQQFPNIPDIKRASITSSDPRYQGAVIVDFDHVTLEAYNLAYGTNKYTQVIADPDNGAYMFSEFLGKTSDIRVSPDSITVRPGGGIVYWDSVRHSISTTDKMMVWDSVANRVASRAIPSGGSGVTTLATFGAGARLPGDTAAFTDSTIYGSFYNDGEDTLVITAMRIVMQGTNDTLTINIEWNDSLNTTGTKLKTAYAAANNNYTGNSYTSFDNTKIPPGNHVWCKSPTVIPGRRPTYLSVTLIGYKKRI